MHRMCMLPIYRAEAPSLIMEQEPLIQKEEKQSSRSREYASSIYREETFFSIWRWENVTLLYINIYIYIRCDLMDYPPNGMVSQPDPPPNGMVWYPFLPVSKTRFSYDFWWFPLGSGEFWKLAIDLTSCFTRQIYEFIHDLQGKRIVWHKWSIAGPQSFVARAQIIHEFIKNPIGKRVFGRKSSIVGPN